MTTENINPLSPSKEKLTYLLEHFQKGKFTETEVIAKSLTKEFPSHQFAWKILGAVFKQTGRINEAINFMLKSVKLVPQDAEAHNNLGVVYQELGKLEEAEASYIKATILQTQYIEAFINLGNVLKDQGKLEKAVNTYKKAISINPDYADAHYNLGLTLKLLDKLEESSDCYTKAIELNPNHYKAFNNLGNVLREKCKTEEAIVAYKNALSINPNYTEAHNNLGNVLKDLGKLEESVKSFKKALLINPNYAYAHNNLGNVLKDQGKLEESVKSFKKALTIKPDFALALNNMGLALKDQGNTKDAIEAFKNSLSIKFEDSITHKNLSFTLLNLGRFEEGLEEYEWRWKTHEFLPQYRHFFQPLWNKDKNLSGKTILIWSEQGVGDTITWSSCISYVAAQANGCILECQEKLVTLLKRSFPNIEVKAEDRSLDSKRNDFDFHIPMGSLYKNLNTEIFKKTKVDSYLIPDQSRVEYWKNKLTSIGKGPYIGVSWKSLVMSPDRIPNYASIFDWFPLLRLPDIKFINLQPKDFEDDLAKVREELGIKVHNFDDLDHFDNIDDVAALCTALDMVVSTKTTVPLISAGVGTPTKLANWKQSAWNNILLNPRGPLVQIYERNTWETWDNVFSSIAEDILKIKNKGVADE